MTMYKPTLILNKLQIFQNDLIVYECNFHKGLNIIYGENSSGKSTILDFIFFALGGELTELREAGKKCDVVYLEASFNGQVATLIRDVEAKKARPMKIYTGPMEEAQKSANKWQVFPYARTANKESFSQVLFRWLGIPEVAGEANGKITMHQILRLLYADQMSPIENIFRFDYYDSPLLRQTVGDLLCGSYDADLYSAQIQFLQSEKEYKEVAAELSNMMNFVSETGQGVTLGWVLSQQKDIEEQIQITQEQIGLLDEKLFHAEVSDGLSQEEQKRAYNTLVDIQKRLAQAKEEKDELELEIADTQKYITSLRKKLRDLDDASVTAEVVHKVGFIYCPSCLAPMENDAMAHSCHLCKSPYNDENAKSRLLGIINDVGQQVKQSDKLQLVRYELLRKCESALVLLNAEWEVANNQYKLANRTPSTELRTEARLLHRKVGSLEQQLINLSEKEVLVKRIKDLSELKEKLNADIFNLTEFISAKKHELEKYLDKAYTAISHNVSDILKKDLDRQSTFKNAEHVTFSFGDNKMAVNGESFFSASSMVFFRNSFILSLFKTSLENPRFRHPRLLIMDSIEDKGMEPERSHNFQNIMKEISDNTETEHQIIYATAMIAPELINSSNVVGRYYTHQNKTLAYKDE